MIKDTYNHNYNYNYNYNYKNDSVFGHSSSNRWRHLKGSYVICGDAVRRTHCVRTATDKMGTCGLCSSWLPDCRLRWEGTASQHRLVQDLHFPSPSNIFLEQPFKVEPTKDLRLRGDNAFRPGVPAWWLVF